MKNLSIDLLKLVIVWAIAVFLIASCGRSAYANGVHPHGELALVGYDSLAYTVRLTDFFCMRHTSMHPHFMAKLEGDTFECAGDLESQSTNPFQLCHHNYLVVIGRASIDSLGAH